ncbi:hypothetical protein N7490_011870 [Penicillium lividum]|nr:hypothetical protein N7490_011870 [Penicillium lividum]
MAPTWEEIIVSKRASLKAVIPAELIIPSNILPALETPGLDVSNFIAQSGWFSEPEVDILKSSATGLLQRLANGSITSETVTKAFCKSAAAAQQLINPLSEIFFDEALETAKSLDEYLKSTGKPKGPLHGLPISIKDNFNIKGKDSTQGFTSRVGQPAESNSPMIQLLLDAGAVLYVKTNVPPGMKRGETYNLLFGKTLNSKNNLWSAGGSSGGEGALIAFGGSCLGVGSDIGGSCRWPAACGGLFTLRPSTQRWSISGNSSLTPGQDSIRAVPGPMARTMEDVILFSKVFAQRAPWTYDPDCVPLEWREIKPRTLKLAVAWDDGSARPTPPVKRALEGAVASLKKAGHEIVEWKMTPEDWKELMEIGMGIFLADAGNWLKKPLANGEPMPANLIFPLEGTPKTLVELHELHVLRDQLRMKWFQKWKSIEGLDGILIPTSPYSICKYDGFKSNYTIIANVLDYAASSFPTGYYADKNIDKPYTDYTPISEADKSLQEEYDPEFCHGAPVSFQIYGQRLEEEKVLMMTEVVSRCISGV